MSAMDQDQLYADVVAEDEPLVRPMRGTGFNTFTEGFLWTNEDVHTVTDHIDFNGVTVAGVAGSMDFGLSVIADGGAFQPVDTSVYAAMFSELKTAAVKTLDRDAFLDFFCLPDGVAQPYTRDADPDTCERSDTWNLFNPDTYQSLRPELSETAQQFFDDTIPYSFEAVGGDQVPYPLHFAVNALTRDEAANLPYLASEETFTAAQNRLEQEGMPLIHVSPLHAFDLGEEVDAAYLSNVPVHQHRLTKNGGDTVDHCRDWIGEDGFLLVYSRKNPLLERDVFPEQDYSVEFLDAAEPISERTAFPTAYRAEPR